MSEPNEPRSPGFSRGSVTDTTITITINLPSDPDRGIVNRTLVLTEGEAREVQRELNRIFGIPYPSGAPELSPYPGGLTADEILSGDVAPRHMTAMEAVEAGRRAETADDVVRRARGLKP